MLLSQKIAVWIKCRRPNNGTQRAIKYAEKRELFFEMNLVRNELLQTALNKQHTKQISVCFNNLVRLWADI